VHRTCSLSCLMQIIIHKCCSFPTYLGLYLCLQIWSKFTAANPHFVRRKTICEDRQIFLPYLSFRPSELPSSHVENVDLPEIIDGGMARIRWNYVDQVTFIRIGQNYRSFYVKGYVNFWCVYYISKNIFSINRRIPVEEAIVPKMGMPYKHFFSSTPNKCPKAWHHLFSAVTNSPLDTVSNKAFSCIRHQQMCHKINMFRPI
jgi:hypothetical protein